jgi:opacity protein-like surface antigen
MKKRALIIMAVIFIAVVMLAPVPAPAATAPEGGDTKSWQFEITPYLFAAGMSGKTGKNLVTADVEMSFDDILNNLDSGFMVLFEARKEPWTFGFEGVYFRLKDEKVRSWAGPLGNSSTGAMEATMTEQLYQLSAGYRVADDRVKVDVIGAARATLLDTRMNLIITTGAPLLPDGGRSMSISQNWWDPVVGVRVLLPIAKEWTAIGYADIGGFGVGSDLTYQFLAGVNWQFSKSVSAKLGYRSLYQDYEHNGFVWDMSSNGFYLGAGFKF